MIDKLNLKLLRSDYVKKSYFISFRDERGPQKIHLAVHMWPTDREFVTPCFDQFLHQTNAMC